MSSPADIDLDALPVDVRMLIESERAARAELEQQVATLGRHNERLAHLVQEFRKALYGKRSEKLSADERQLAFEDLETALATAETAKEAADATTPAAGHDARAPVRRNLGRLPKELPRIEQVLEPASGCCPCGGEMTRIGEERTERLDIVPAQFRVIATVRPKYACRVCSGAVVQAPAPAHLIEGALPTEGLIAHVLVAKYADHLPLYRQAQIYRRTGIDLHRSTLADWVGKAAFHLAPVVDRLAWHMKGSTRLFMDETTAPVLDPGRGRTRTGYLWALARDDRRWGGSDPPGVVYIYAPGRGAVHAEAMLQGFTGILQVDGYSAYKTLAGKARPEGPFTLAHCWAHGRRQLREVFERDGSPMAEEGLRRIAELYRIEAELKGRSSEERRAARQVRSRPIVEAFRTWLDAQRARVSPKSRIGEKLGYFANHWAGLCVFLGDGRVEIDSNAVENTIRPLALGRKNALFAGHDEGARSWAHIASLIETAKMNDLDPFAYLKATLEALAKGHPNQRIDELLPWAFNQTSS
ncbi:IS66 family transposase [Minwuia thermotolerans]|uniref:IS66 family transposase n=1 Tax=Minwuia thermotolerans TaxID=2056226 RepID=A0A2M9FVA8_9PROT|nr:IS66 family transposase [Minwuia thermotolerans]PJK27364.1 IS66 family transposase [Minwuia thermotolerans]